MASFKTLGLATTVILLAFPDLASAQEAGARATAVGVLPTKLGRRTLEQVAMILEEFDLVTLLGEGPPDKPMPGAIRSAILTVLAEQGLIPPATEGVGAVQISDKLRNQILYALSLFRLVGSGGTASNVGDNGVTSAAIADGAVATADLADGSVTTAKLADKAVTAAKVGSEQSSSGMVLTADGSGGATWATSSGGLSGTVPIASGGTGQTGKTAAFDALAPTTTKGDLIVFNGTNNIRLPVGADTQILTADSTQASGVKWAAAGGGGGGGLPVVDTTVIVQGSADNTKQLRFEVDGLTSGTTRVATPPDANFTMARSDAAQTFTGVQTFSSSPTAPTGGALSERFGAGAGASGTPGINNTFVGNGAGASCTSNFNVAVGTNSLAAATGGANAACGEATLQGSVSGFDNCAFGAGALKDNSGVGANENNAIGTNAMEKNISGGQNCALGRGALRYTTTSSGNTAIGHNAGQGASGASNFSGLVAVGYQAGMALTTGANNVLIGSAAGDALNTGGSNIAVGKDALGAGTGAAQNLMIGESAGLVNTASANVFMGYQAGMANTAAAQNTLIGHQAGLALNGNGAGQGEKNTLVGYFAGKALVGAGGNAAYGNTFLGSECGRDVTTGYFNTLVGRKAGRGNGAAPTGIENVFVGYDAGMRFTTGGQNVAIGPYAGVDQATEGRGLTTGTSNVLIGYQAGSARTAATANMTGTANVYIGRDAGETEDTASNQFISGSAAAPLNDVWFGKGKVAAAPTAYTIRGTGSSAGGTAGGDLQLSGGTANGDADAGGSILFITDAANDGSTTATSAKAKVKISPAGITSLFKGADVASGATITPTGNVFHVTGTTQIDNISTAGITAGTTLVLIFNAGVTVSNAGNIKPAGGTFGADANDTLTVVYDGTSWFETARAVIP